MVRRVGGLLSLFFTNAPVRSAAEAKRSDSGRYARYFRRMLRQGIYLPPSPFEAWFPSLAHGEREIEITLKGHEQALKGER
jgi:glutamate-1-semialdehyde 2,1-aminomutase